MSIPALPGVDLVPSVSSRVVTIDAVTITEGEGVKGDTAWVEFSLPVDLNVKADGKVIAASTVRVPLKDGRAQVRLPTYDDDAVTITGDRDWGIIVRKGWGGQHRGGCNCGSSADGAYLVRIPVGTTSISLASLTAVRPLRGKEKQYAITGAGATIREGSQWDAALTLNGGILTLDLTVPPGGVAWTRGIPSKAGRVADLDPGVYTISSIAIASLFPDLPVQRPGTLEVIGNIGNSVRSWRFAEWNTRTLWHAIRQSGTDTLTWHPLRPWEQSDIPAGADVTTLDPGVWTVRSVSHGEGLTGLPEAYPGTLEVVWVQGQVVKGYRFTPYGKPYMWITDAQSRSQWRIVLTASSIEEWLAQDRDVYTLPAGQYTIRSASVAETVTHLPEIYPGTLEIIGQGSVQRAARFYPYQKDYHWEANQSSTGLHPDGWAPWRKSTSGGVIPGVDLAARHRVLWEDFSRRVGPVETTAEAVIALRFDHGLNNFRDKILPVLRRHGFVSTNAMNSRTWDRAESAGVTPAEADGWADVEFANHGATHTDATTVEGLIDEIVTGRNELQSQLPKHRIDGWVVPGVGNGSQSYMGFGSGTAPENYSDTVAGQLILGHHAWASGHIEESRVSPLDGISRVGFRHTGYEGSDGYTTFTQAVTDAITRGGRASLMLHPSQLDLTGKLTTADFTRCMDWLKTKVDAGDVQVVTLGQMTLAERATTASTSPAIQDTGWVDISTTVPRYVSGTLHLRRKGTDVYMRATDLIVADQSTTWNSFPNLIPAGFRIDLTGYTYFAAAPAPQNVNTDAPGPVRIDGNGSVLYYGAQGSKRLRAICQWTTADAWPSALPGSPS